jgi:hypothetical protein
MQKAIENTLASGNASSFQERPFSLEANLFPESE